MIILLNGLKYIFLATSVAGFSACCILAVTQGISLENNSPSVEQGTSMPHWLRVTAQLISVVPVCCSGWLFSRDWFTASTKKDVTNSSTAVDNSVTRRSSLEIRFQLIIVFGILTVGLPFVVTRFPIYSATSSEIWRLNWIFTMILKDYAIPVLRPLCVLLASCTGGRFAVIVLATGMMGEYVLHGGVITLVCMVCLFVVSVMTGVGDLCIKGFPFQSRPDELFHQGSECSTNSTTHDTTMSEESSLHTLSSGVLWRSQVTLSLVSVVAEIGNHIFRPTFGRSSSTIDGSHLSIMSALIGILIIIVSVTTALWYLKPNSQNGFKKVMHVLIFWCLLAFMGSILCVLYWNSEETVHQLTVAFGMHLISVGADWVKCAQSLLVIHTVVTESRWQRPIVLWNGGSSLQQSCFDNNLVCIPKKMRNRNYTLSSCFIMLTLHSGVSQILVVVLQDTYFMYHRSVGLYAAWAGVVLVVSLVLLVNGAKVFRDYPPKSSLIDCHGSNSDQQSTRIETLTSQVLYSPA